MQDPFDAAMPGGIDFNDVYIEREGSRDGIPFHPTAIHNAITIYGIVPVIRAITPIPSALPLLGLLPQNDDVFEVTSRNFPTTSKFE